MGKLVVKLKQHSPLIFFQHNQLGGTLRATEVKPKFDRFVLNCLSEAKKDEAIEQGWIKQDVANNKIWLDYKLKIQAIGIPKEYLVASYLKTRNIIGKPNNVEILSSTPFFAQEESNRHVIDRNGRWVQGEWNEIEKKGLFWEEGLELTFFSIKEDVLQTISRYLCEFFICTNFGSRSSKGFGGFTVNSINGKLQNPDSDFILQSFRRHFQFAYSREIGRNLSNTFRNINQDYQLIKSGVNNRQVYKKSLLYLFAHIFLSLNWEKRFIKQEIADVIRNQYGYELLVTSDEGRQNRHIDDSFQGVYLRAMLGHGDHWEFLLSRDGQRVNEKLVVNITSDEVERFQSPLLFKVINGYLYIVGNDITSEILDREFKIEYSIKGGRGIRNIKTCKISTPKSFSLPEFVGNVLGDDQLTNDLNYQELFNKSYD